MLWHEKARHALKMRKVRYIDLAAELNCTEGAIGHYLNGRREPSVETLRTIANAAGMSLSELVGDDPRVIADETEKRLIEEFRQLPGEQQQLLFSLLKSMKTT